ncbi:MAG: RNA-binding S4 domain-containing protein [Hyphomicrobiaceae bacterium]
MGAAGERDWDTEDAKTQAGEQRLDKWLWFARVIKTRTQAAQLVTDGKVRVNRQRSSKPSQALKPGDVVTVTVRGHVRVLKVLAPGERRGPPAEARLLFDEVKGERERESPSSASGAQSVQAPLSTGPVQHERSGGRPTKRDRRVTRRFLEGKNR